MATAPCHECQLTDSCNTLFPHAKALSSFKGNRFESLCSICSFKFVCPATSISLLCFYECLSVPVSLFLMLSESAAAQWSCDHLTNQLSDVRGRLCSCRLVSPHPGKEVILEHGSAKHLPRFNVDSYKSRGIKRVTLH